MRKLEALTALSLLGTTGLVGSSPSGLIPSFGLFNIVNFKNNECTGVTGNTATGLKGTCLSSSECSSEGGMAQGNCAAGFGTCCVFRKSGCTMTVSKNGTYITNPDFPTAEPTAAQTCTYTIKVPEPGKETCQIRLDFRDVVLEPGANGAVAANSRITAIGGTGTTTTDPPEVSGTLSGMHMYVQLGTADPTITVEKIARQTNGKWEIRVDFIHCTSPWKAPAGCHQYLKDDAGMIRSYNNDCTTGATSAVKNKELTEQNNRICIRKNAGFSKVSYTGSPLFEVGGADVGAMALSAVGTGAGTAMNTAPGNGCGDSMSTVTFSGGNSHCGEILAPTSNQKQAGTIMQTSGPYVLTHLSSATATAGSRGFCIMYSQS